MLTTLFIGRNLIKLEQTESTNSYLSALSAKEKVTEGTVVVADFQTEGKGQSGASWSSEAGKNILMSVLLKPRFLSTKNIFLLSKAVALAIKDTLNAYDIVPKTKWPNDIYVDGNKIAGALIENIMRGEQVQQSIVGIGLNVNQEIFPLDIPNPVSMKMTTGQKYSVDDCLFSLCNYLEKRYLQLKAGRFTEIADEYLNSLYLFQEKKHDYKQLTLLNSEEQILSAEIINVEDDGMIVLKKENGSLEKFRFKEIAFF